MSTIFTPPLSTHTVITLPRSSSSSKCTVNFKALPSSSSLPLRTDLPLPQLWTNLGSSGGSEWRAIPFLPLDRPSPPSDETASWPILSLSSSNESPPLLPPVLPRFATLSFDVDSTFAGREFGFTYRLQHPNQSIEWLGSDGSNGSFRFELDQKEEGGDGEGGEPLLVGGRWKGERASEEGNHNKRTTRVGEEGEVLPGVRIGEGWEGFGVSMDERDTPTPHLLSSSTTTPLSIILLQPTASNPPIHHVGLPSTPIILSADPSSYFLASGSAIKLKHSVDGFAPKATFHSDASSTSPSLPAGLDLLPSSGETTALLSTKTKAIFLHSTITTLPFPISVDLSKASSFANKTSKTLAVYSESGGSVVQLEEGGGGGFLLDRLDGPLSTLKLVELSRVAGSDHGLLVGSIDPPLLTSHSKAEDFPTTTAATLKPISSFIEDLSETASEPNEEEVVNGANSEVEDANANSDEETTSHARVLGGGAEIERRGGFAAFLRWWATLWQAVLSLFGVVQKEAPTKTVTFDEEEEVIPAPTETTPLLTHNHSHTPSASSTLTSSPIVTKTFLPSPSSPLAPTPLFYAPSGLRGGLLISSPGSFREAPTNLVLKARLASSSSEDQWTELKLKGELETVSNSQGGNWFKGTVVVDGEGENLVGQGEEDWAVWVGEGEE